jgi:hypothetical protein
MIATIQRQTPGGAILCVCPRHDALIRAGTITPRDHAGHAYSQVRQGLRRTGERCALCRPFPKLKTAAALRAQDTAFLRKPQHSMDDTSESEAL